MEYNVKSPNSTHILNYSMKDYRSIMHKLYYFSTF